MYYTLSILIIGDNDVYKTRTGHSIGIGTRYETEQQLLQQFQTCTDVEKRKKLSLVIYHEHIIYNKWDSQYELTFGMLCDWFLEIDKKNGFYDYIRTPLMQYLSSRYSVINTILEIQENKRLRIFSDLGFWNEYTDPGEFIKYVHDSCSLGQRSIPVKDVFTHKVLLVELDGTIIFNALTDGSITEADLYDFFVNGEWSSTSSYRGIKTDSGALYTQSYDVSNNFNRKMKDDPNGVTQDYATYYTIFRGKK